MSTVAGLVFIYLGVDGSTSLRVVQGMFGLLYALVVAVFSLLLVGYFKAELAIQRSAPNPPATAISAQRNFWIFAVLALVIVAALTVWAVTMNPFIMNGNLADVGL